MAEFVQIIGRGAGAAQTRTTRTGYRFTRDMSHRGLGEAWRDPSGMIWGDIVKRPNGSTWELSHAAASRYCQSIGAQLPSREDFERLRDYMGAAEGRYQPQILPNLTYTENETTHGYFLWSSSLVDSRNADLHWYFYSLDGTIDNGRRYDANFQAFRCVVPFR